MRIRGLGKPHPRTGLTEVNCAENPLHIRDISKALTRSHSKDIVKIYCQCADCLQIVHADDAESHRFVIKKFSATEHMADSRIVALLPRKFYTAKEVSLSWTFTPWSCTKTANVSAGNPPVSISIRPRPLGCMASLIANPSDAIF